MAKIKNAQLEDESLRNYVEVAKKEVETEFELKGDGVLFRVKNGLEKLVIKRGMQNEIIRQCHESGHFGWKKTEYLLPQDYWLPHMHLKVQKFILNCIKCILAERKSGKADGWLSPIIKGETPLDTLHVDFLGPIPSTRKSYNHLYVYIDAFPKMVWIYPTKSVTAEEAINCHKRQGTIFGNPRRIVSDRGSAFTSNTFPEEYKHVSSLQQMLNSTFQRSIGRKPFELLVGSKKKHNYDMELEDLIEKEVIECYENERSDLNYEARANIEGPRRKSEDL